MFNKFKSFNKDGIIQVINLIDSKKFITVDINLDLNIYKKNFCSQIY